MKKYIPYIYILLSATLWGLIGLFNRHFSALGFSAQSIVMVRNFGGLLMMTLIFGLFDRSVFKIKAKHLPYFFGTGVVSVLVFTLCYFRCQQLCSLAVAAILLYTSPAFVVLLSALLFKDPITKKKLLALGFAFLGCTFVSGIWSGGLTMTGTGLLIGICSGFFYGMYSIFARYALRHYKPLTVTYYTFVFAGISSLLVANPAEVVTLIQPSMIGTVIAFVLLCTVLPYIFYTVGLAKVDSGRASIIASVEPVVAALVGIAAFGEPMTLMVVLGLACILATVYILR